MPFLSAGDHRRPLLFVGFTKRFHVNDLMSDSTRMLSSTYMESVLGPGLACASAL